jgi:hypothetical protein
LPGKEGREGGKEDRREGLGGPREIELMYKTTVFTGLYKGCGLLKTPGGVLRALCSQRTVPFPAGYA